MEASGVFVFLRLSGEYKVKNGMRSFKESEEGLFLESDRIRYTKYLEMKVRAFVPKERLYEDCLFLIDPRGGNATLVDLKKEIKYTFELKREKPSKLKNVSVRFETRTG